MINVSIFQICLSCKIFIRSKFHKKDITNIPLSNSLSCSAASRWALVSASSRSLLVIDSFLVVNSFVKVSLALAMLFFLAEKQHSLENSF